MENALNDLREGRFIEIVVVSTQVEFKVLVQQRAEENPYSGALWATRITAEERERISLGLAMNKSQQEIADELGRDKSAISREIGRNRLPDGSYSAFKAQERARIMAASRHAGG